MYGGLSGARNAAAPLHGLRRAHRCVGLAAERSSPPAAPKLTGSQGQLHAGTQGRSAPGAPGACGAGRDINFAPAASHRTRPFAGTPAAQSFRSSRRRGSGIGNRLPSLHLHLNRNLGRAWVHACSHAAMHVTQPCQQERGGGARQQTEVPSPRVMRMGMPAPLRPTQVMHRRGHTAAPLSRMYIRYAQA